MDGEGRCASKAWIGCEHNVIVMGGVNILEGVKSQLHVFR